MPPRSLKPHSARRPGRQPEPRARRRFSKAWILAALAVIAVAALAWVIVPESPEHLRARAEAATQAHDLRAALKLWREVNQTRLARGSTYLAEARACLALNRAADAERALRRAIDAAPEAAEPWRIELQLLMVEDRPLEALRTGWKAYDAVSPEARREVLHDLTFALLADLPDQTARERLGQWIEADPSDADARVALLQRVATQPNSGDPDRQARIATLTAILKSSPGRTPAREALAVALADAGQPDVGRQVLDSWPADSRDARYWRLLGRWQLDFDNQPAAAVESLQRALIDLPHDWRTQFRLARALKRTGRSEEANRTAETVRRLHEVLDPATLGPRLHKDLKQLDDPHSLLDLADLCARAGLTRLAEAWRRESIVPTTSDRRPLANGR